MKYFKINNEPWVPLKKKKKKHSQFQNQQF
jgi:hypothetical protein